MNVETDRNFVVSAWSSSYRMSRHAGLLGMRDYAPTMHREIGRIIGHPTTVTIVAEETGELDDKGRPFLYGFACAAPGNTYVYYVYVKTAFRRARARLGLPTGFAQLMLESMGFDLAKPFHYASSTDYISEIRDGRDRDPPFSNRIPFAVFNPIPARYL